MVQLLEQLALDKLRGGDEDAARAALQEKMSVAEVRDRSRARAKANYVLAEKLADKIRSLGGQLQTGAADQQQAGDFIGQEASGGVAAQPTSAAAAAASAAPAAPETPSAWEQSLMQAQQRLREAEARKAAAEEDRKAAAEEARVNRGDGASRGDSFGSSSSFGSSIGGGFGSSSSSGVGVGESSWERTLAASFQRLQQEQDDIAERARQLREAAERDVLAARDRIKAADADSLQKARERLDVSRGSAQSSLVEAQARLREQDRRAMSAARAIMARRRRGEYVTEDELEWAFQQLERLL